MESTIADDFLHDLADLSDEDIPSKKQKNAEIEPLEKSKILDSVELLCILSSIHSKNLEQTNDFLEKCNNIVVDISTE